jgi:choline-sulfatase
MFRAREAAVKDRRACRRVFFALAFLLAAPGCRRAAFPGSHVFVISIDTLRADHLPAYGYRSVETPAIDALARDGLLFETAIAHVPLTLPSHATLFTGQLPFDNGVRDNLGYRLAAGHSTLAGLLRARGYATGGAVSAVVLDHATGIAQGFDFWDDAVEAREAGQALGQVQRPGAETERLLEDWLGRVPAGKPVFAFLHLYEPHTPYAPPEPFASKYSARPYDGEIAAADAVVGSFLSWLRRRGLYDGALIVLLSDHGEGLGDHGEDEHGIFLYREAIRVPLLVKLPGNRDAGTRVRAPAGLVDVFPTIAAVLGMEPPAGLAGAPLWPGSQRAERRIYSETMFPRFHFGWSDLASLVDGRSHYIEAPRAEIYDWTADASERRNLAEGLSPAFRSMRAALRSMSRPLDPPGASDPETVKKLASLGYLGAGSVAGPDGPLPDPKDRIGLVGRLKEAGRLAEGGRSDRAVELLQEVVEENPAMLDAREALARTLRRAGRPEEAFEALLAVDRMQPGTVQVLLGLADLAVQNNVLDRARTYALAAEAAGSSDAALMLATVALAADDLPEARRQTETAIRAHPKSRAPLLILARIEIAAGNPPAALAALDRMRAMPGAAPLADASFLRGDALARLNRGNEAREAFRAEIRDFPDNPRGYTGLALLEASEGRPVEAHRALTDLLARARTADAYAAAARAYEVLGDRAAGLRVRASAARLFPKAREGRGG